MAASSCTNAEDWSDWKGMRSQAPETHLRPEAENVIGRMMRILNDDSIQWPGGRYKKVPAGCAIEEPVTDPEHVSAWIRDTALQSVDCELLEKTREIWDNMPGPKHMLHHLYLVDKPQNGTGYGGQKEMRGWLPLLRELGVDVDGERALLDLLRQEPYGYPEVFHLQKITLITDFNRVCDSIDAAAKSCSFVVPHTPSGRGPSAIGCCGGVQRFQACKNLHKVFKDKKRTAEWQHERRNRDDDNRTGLMMTNCRDSMEAIEKWQHVRDLEPDRHKGVAARAAWEPNDHHGGPGGRHGGPGTGGGASSSHEGPGGPGPRPHGGGKGIDGPGKKGDPPPQPSRGPPPPPRTPYFHQDGAGRRS